jgi:hypothetical protein
LRIGLEFAARPLMIVTALVDTGAPVSIFDGRLAVRIGLAPESLRTSGYDTVPLRAFTGAPSRAYLHDVTLYVGVARDHTALTAAVAFTDPDDPPLTFNLLGRRGFLDRMLFGLDEGASPANAGEAAMYIRVL